MADEFQTGICSGNWWNSSTNGFNGVSSPCSLALNDIRSCFGWPTEMVDIKARSSEDSASVSGSSIDFLDTQKLQGADSVGGGGSSVLLDSTLQMMGFGLSSPTMDWNQVFIRSSGRTESNIQTMLQEDSSLRPNFRQARGMESPQVQKDWSPKNFSSGGEDSSTNAFKQINQNFTLDQQPLDSSNSTGDCTMICQGLPTNFPMGSALYGSPSTLLQGLFEPDHPQLQQSSMNYPSPTNYFINSNELSPSWPKSPQFLQTSPLKQQTSSQFHFPNNSTPLWNTSAAAMNDVRSSFFPSPQTQFVTPTFEAKPNCSKLTDKTSTEKARNSGLVEKKSSSEPSFKRPRIETPSPLPTFKVRKEKLGDRVTALQQLVSPFGKTDTASVLFEAIEYIKFLHDQVSVLSTPYMKNGAHIQHQQNSDKSKNHQGPKQDLRSRGLCLVPTSTTFPVTDGSVSDFWTSTFGGTFG
ncbi:hypothetical protein HHK36_023744 [Tetracentron sinense]|uniref:BHLH domain-containing protein n=1 Tax=Tetracentron sinense TaxID=13715 RepID=A0A834YLS8_TETSI|nr:hypothetical protein HHK36_023744 [Tetracentron sinense]